MSRRTLTIILGILTGLLAAGSAPARDLDLKRIAAAADSAARAQISAGITPGVTVAVAKGGEVVFVRGYGQADVEVSAPARPETVYQIGSLTKQFTAAAVMRLVEAGKISLDAPLTKYLPDYPTQGRRVTVRHLLNHTSGIKDYAELGMGYWLREFRLDLSDREMIDLFAKQPFDFEPGEKYRYNNSGYYLLGVIIERVTGTPYGDHVERELLQPLGLSKTVYGDNRRVIPNRADGYAYERGGELIKAPYVSTRVYGAAGGLCSTAGDLIRWTHLLHSGRVVTAASLKQMTSPTVLSTGEAITYGFGLDLARLGELQKIAHGGDAAGFNCYLTHYPDSGLTIAVLTNSDKGMPPGRIEEAVARSAHGLTSPAVLDLPLTAEDIARYEGTYLAGRAPRPTEVRVFGDNGRLKVQVGQGKAFLFRHQGDHVFVPEFDDKVRLVFSVEAGRAEGVTLHQGSRVTQATRKQ